MIRKIVLALLLLAAAAASWSVWQWGNRPIPIPLSFDEPFPSVSFAPYRWGESPISHDFPTPEEIEADLASLKGVAKGVRTYTALEGMDRVPAIAGKYGLDVIHSAWLGPKRDKDDMEVSALIAAANAHPDTIKRVIVGNEVLLRKDLPVGELIAYIRKVKAAVKQPVSYADVWAFWLKYPEVAKEVDFITIHILPYWEDEPVGVDDASQHLLETYHIIANTFPGKPILIGESGWPTRGRERGPSKASVADAARFVRTLAKVSKEHGFDYNVVEAFDQPWKAKLEGTVGANWGVVDSDREVKFGMSGPVQENRHWLNWAILSVVLGGALGLGALWQGEGVSGSTRARMQLLLPFLGQAMAGLMVWQGMNAWWLAYDWPGLIWAVVRIAIHSGLAIILMLSWGAMASDKPLRSDLARWGERLVMIFATAAIVDTLILFVAGRYRDIPELEFLVPCFGLWTFAVLRRATGAGDWIEAAAVGRLFAQAGQDGGFPLARLYTLGLWGSAVLAPLSEALALSLGDDFVHAHPHFSDQWPLLVQALWANEEMLVWSAMLLILSLPFLAEWLRAVFGRLEGAPYKMEDAPYGT